MLGKLNRTSVHLGVSRPRGGNGNTLGKVSGAPLAASAASAAAKLTLNEAAARESLSWFPQFRGVLPEISNQTIRLAAKLAATMSPANRVALFMSLEPTPATAKIVNELSLALHRASGGPVLLMNADLENQGPELMGIQEAPGLDDILNGTETLASTVRLLEDAGVSYLGRGLQTPNSSPLHKPALTALLELLHSEFAYVLINGPALSQSDAPLLATVADGVVLCVPSGQCRREEVLNAKAELEAFKAKLLGVVIVE
jgi:Mrp family chromosome partitioning ATPase